MFYELSGLGAVVITPQMIQAQALKMYGTTSPSNTQKTNAYNALKVAQQSGDLTSEGQQAWQEREKAKAKRRKVFHNVTEGVAKVGLAPSRAAFITLVRLNVLGLAKKIIQANAKNPGKIRDFWEGFGGKYSSLIKTANAGKNKPLIKLNGLGEAVTAATAGAAAASSTPILVAIVKLFKSLGINAKDVEGAVKTAKSAIKSGDSSAKDVTVTVTPAKAKTGEWTIEEITDGEISPLMDNVKKYAPLAVLAAGALYFIGKK